MMTSDERALSHLGLCRRAGKIISGEELVIQAIRESRAHLVIISIDISANTEKKIRDKCTSFQVPIVQRFDR
jgi:ribosomal protein L7Ae-like RNA K-turn-binding protein